MDGKELIDSLKSSCCPGCNGYKQSGKSFCRTCYGRLPKPQQMALYRRVGIGYEEAHAEAMNIIFPDRGVYVAAVR